MRPDFQDWASRLKEARGHLHRKVWEWCFISQALYERGMLKPGCKGIGFAVGQEPLTALFASYGAEVLATDLFTEQAIERGWTETNQHAQGPSTINARGICEAEQFNRLVKFRFADMNSIPSDLGADFDFVWSSCAFEHLGTIDRGMEFVVRAMRLLRPGGVAVHTTEFNVSSNRSTVSQGETVLYRKRDISELAARLRHDGHEIELDFQIGNSPADNFIDAPPYAHSTHIKVAIGKYVSTSLGLVIRKGRTAAE